GNALTKTGSNMVTLNNANLYSGGTSVNAGTLDIANAGGLGAGATTVATGATLAMDFTGNLGSSNNIHLNGTLIGSSGHALSGNHISLSSSGIIRCTLYPYTTLFRTGNALTKTGSNMVTLNNANLYSGGTSVNAGTLDIANGGGLGAGATTVATGATLAMD